MLLKTLAILGVASALPASHAADILLVTNNNGTTQSLNDFLVASGHDVTRDDRTAGPDGVIRDEPTKQRATTLVAWPLVPPM